MRVNRRFLFLPVVLLITLLVTIDVRAEPAPAPAGKWALIVGVDRYDDQEITPLRFAEADARQVGNALIATGFPRGQVFVLTSHATGRMRATRENIVDWLVRLRGNVRPGDIFVFGFSGHGISLQKESYLLAANTIPEPVENLEDSALRVGRLRQLIAQIPASRILIALDACRNDPRAGRGGGNNPLDKKMARDLKLARRPGTVDSGPMVATIFACQVGQRSYEWPEKQQGYFSYFLARGLRGAARDASGAVTLPSLVIYLETQVSKEVRLWKGSPAQTPWAQTEGTGVQRWILAGKALRATANEATSPPVAQEETAVTESAPPPEKSLLTRAQDAFAAGHFADPPGDNTVELSRQALREDHDNAAARDLETKAAAAYENQARLAISQKDTARALQIYKRLFTLFPERGDYLKEITALEVPPVPDVVGLWAGTDSAGARYRMDVRGDGTYTATWSWFILGGTLHGTWVCTDPRERRFVLKHEGWTTDFTLSADLQNAEGAAVSNGGERRTIRVKRNAQNARPAESLKKLFP